MENTLVKIKYILKNWKLGVHLVFRTKRFGVNNEWWCHFDSSLGVSTKQILWDIVRIRPILRNYELMKVRATKLHFLSAETCAMLWPKSQGSKNKGEKMAENEVGASIPDPEMEKACLEAYDAGERTTLQDRINELRSRLAAGPSNRP